MAETKDKSGKKDRPKCGIVMPISAIDNCDANHWAEVLEIFSESIEDAEFDPNLVSRAEDVGIIQKTIIQNLYDNPIVVTDVSGKNPNVMFELGIRLAFDKPTIIVKDDKTSYSFDTSPIEHLEYPRDLRFSKINEFKAKLTEKIIKTYEKASADTNYTTFLKHFGEFKVAKLDKKEVSGQEFMLDELKGLKDAMRRLENSLLRSGSENSRTPKLDFRVSKIDELIFNEYVGKIKEFVGASNVSTIEHEDHRHIQVTAENVTSLSKITQIVESIIPPEHISHNIRRVLQPRERAILRRYAKNSDES